MAVDQASKTPREQGICFDYTSGTWPGVKQRDLFAQNPPVRGPRGGNIFVPRGMASLILGLPNHV